MTPGMQDNTLAINGHTKIFTLIGTELSTANDDHSNRIFIACKNTIKILVTKMDADHVTAWSKGGATDIGNCQMLCKTHNRAKGNR